MIQRIVHCMKCRRTENVKAFTKRNAVRCRKCSRVLVPLVMIGPNLTRLLEAAKR